MINVINHACGVYNRRIDALSTDDTGTWCADESYDNLHEIIKLNRQIETLNAVKRKIDNHANYQIMFATK